MEDIDPEFAELLGWNGGMDVRPVLDYYGLMVVHLRYRWRKRIVEFVDKMFTDKFVIGFHVQIGNRVPTVFGNMVDQIVSATQYLLGNGGNAALELPINDGQDILVYISTDCGDGSALNRFMESVRIKVKELQFDNRGEIVVELRENQKRLPEGMGHSMESSYQMPSMADCIEILAEAQIDAEVLGLTDVLVLPSLAGKYSSSFTRLSRALMMMRHRTICKGITASDFQCKNFETKQKTAFTTSL